MRWQAAAALAAAAFAAGDLAAAAVAASGANPSNMFAAMPPSDMMPNAMAMRRDE